MSALSYTKEQHEAAMRSNHALHYAQAHGYALIRDGQFYRMKDHDSMVFTQNGYWFWNSRGLKGKAVEFIIHYELDNSPNALVQAIRSLAGESDVWIPDHKADERRSEERAAFVLPGRAANRSRMTAYLCQTRGIHYQILTEMVAQKILYESSTTRPNGTVSQNACFVSYNAEGKPCSAFLRGMGNTPYKREVKGGDKRWGWLLKGADPREVCVFEACIDAASYASLLLMQGENAMQGRDYLALGGLNITPLWNYLEGSAVKSVRLMLDNDNPGREAVQRFREALTQKGYQVQVIYPETGKDWNDALLAHREKQQGSISKEAL